MQIKLTKKILIILIITIITNIILLPTINFADEVESSISEMPSPLTNPEDYDPTDDLGSSPVTIKLAAKVINWIRNIGVIIGALVLTIIGVKYMLAAGAEEKAQYKETLVPVLIGVVMLLGSMTLIIAIAGLFD